MFFVWLLKVWELFDWQLLASERIRIWLRSINALVRSWSKYIPARLKLMINWLQCYQIRQTLRRQECAQLVRNMHKLINHFNKINRKRVRQVFNLMYYHFKNFRLICFRRGQRHNPAEVAWDGPTFSYSDVELNIKWLVSLCVQGGCRIHR